jgi:hypothetical protein
LFFESFPEGWNEGVDVTAIAAAAVGKVSDMGPNVVVAAVILILLLFFTQDWHRQVYFKRCAKYSHFLTMSWRNFLKYNVSYLSYLLIN